MMNVITAKEIIISGIGDYQMLEWLKVEIEVDQHSVLSFSCVIDADAAQMLALNIKPICEVSVDIAGQENNGHFFYGECSWHSISHNGDLYNLHVEAISLTKKVDLVCRSRSFQDIKMTYMQLIQSVMKGYKNHSEIFVNAILESPTNKFILQHRQTDWEFIKKVASLTNSYLCPDMTTGKIQFYIGVPKGNVHIEEKRSCIISNRLKDFSRSQDNNLIPKFGEEEWIEYTFTNRNYLVALGDVIRLDEQTIYVRKATMEYTDISGVVYSTITAGTKTAKCKEICYHEKIQGLTLKGTVIDRAHAYSKIHLDIDPEQDIAIATWFREADFFTAGNFKGWTGMHELGDRVNVFFPTHEENDAYILDVIRQDYSKTNHAMQRLEAVAQQNAPIGSSQEFPQYFSAPNGQEIFLNGNAMMFSAAESASFLQIDGKAGVFMQANEGMVLTALHAHFGEVVQGNGTSSIPSKKIRLQAGLKIQILSGNSQIKMENSEITGSSLAIHEIVEN